VIGIETPIERYMEDPDIWLTGSDWFLTSTDTRSLFFAAAAKTGMDPDIATVEIKGTTSIS
jgi:hypothetical protein